MSEIEKRLSYKVDLARKIKKTYIDTLFAAEDNLAHRFDITLVREGAAIDLPENAAVNAYFVRYADKETLPITGSCASGGKVSVVLPKGCYNKTGQFAIIIKVSDSSIINTVFYGEGTMFASSTDTVIDNERVIPTLSELLAQIAAMEAANKAASKATADANAAAQRTGSAATKAMEAADNANAKAEKADNAAQSATDAAQAAVSAAAGASAAEREAHSAATQATEATNDADAKAKKADNAAQAAVSAAAGANDAAQEAGKAAAAAERAAENAEGWSAATATAIALAAGAVPAVTVHTTEDGHKQLEFGIPQGADGKSAYQYAQEGGYAGTEAEFAQKLASEPPAGYRLLTKIDFDESAEAFEISQINGQPIWLKAMAVYMDRAGDGVSAKEYITPRVTYVDEMGKKCFTGSYLCGAGAQGNCWCVRCEIDGEMLKVDSSSMEPGTNQQMQNGWMTKDTAIIGGWLRQTDYPAKAFTALEIINNGNGNVITPGSTMWIFGKEAESDAQMG